ncbi:MAG TPA: hypothetical protein VGP14_05750 [Casimicrobiaceae bacterium]|nr:hypothetical protein [Casimicrobiaceae bacterium]
MHLFSRAQLLIAPLALLAACATAPVGPPVAAPRFVVGDHWQYRVIDNMRRGAVSQVDAEIVALGGNVATLYVVRVDDGRRSEWTDELESDGSLRAGILGDREVRRFAPAASLLAFPLGQGKTWSQTIPTFRTDIQLADQILIYGDVRGRTAVSVPAGSFDAVQIYRVIQLDDRQPWRTRTTRRDQVWYAPEVKGVVREAREATYAEPGDSGATQVYTERTVTELVSFRPGRA